MANPLPLLEFRKKGQANPSGRMKGGRSPRANGVKMGRKPILTPYQIKEARQRIAKGEKTREVAKVFNVSISTISRLADAR